MYKFHLPPVYTLAASFTQTSDTSGFTIHNAMLEDVAASRSTHASAHHNNAMMVWGYVSYRPPLPSYDILQERDGVDVTSVPSNLDDCVNW